MNSHLKFPEELIKKIKHGEWIQNCYSCQRIYLETYPFYIHTCSKCNSKFCLSCLRVVKNNNNPKKNVRYCTYCY